METVLSDLKKELSQEKEANQKLKDDLALASEKEAKITKTLATVVFFSILIICIIKNQFLCNFTHDNTG